MFSRPKILFLVSLLFVALLNPKFNPYLLFKFLIFYHSSLFTFYIYNIIRNCTHILSIYIAVFSVHIHFPQTGKHLSQQSDKLIDITERVVYCNCEVAKQGGGCVYFRFPWCLVVYIYNSVYPVCILELF